MYPSRRPRSSKQVAYSGPNATYPGIRSSIRPGIRSSTRAWRRRSALFFESLLLTSLLLTLAVDRQAESARPLVDVDVGVEIGGGYDDGYVGEPVTAALVPALSLSTEFSRHFDASLFYRGEVRTHGGELIGAVGNLFSARADWKAGKHTTFSIHTGYESSRISAAPEVAGAAARPPGPSSHLFVEAGPTLILDRKTAVSINYLLTRRTAERPNFMATSSHGLVLLLERGTSSRSQILMHTENRLLLLANEATMSSHDLLLGYRRRLTRHFGGEFQIGPVALMSITGTPEQGPEQDSVGQGLTWGGIAGLYLSQPGLTGSIYLERSIDPHPIQVAALWSESITGRLEWLAKPGTPLRILGGLYLSGPAPSHSLKYWGGWTSVGIRTLITEPVSIGLDASRFIQKATDDPLDLTIERNVLLFVVTAGSPYAEVTYE